MQELREQAFQAANRVDLVVGFVVGASISAETELRILDGFRVTQDLLLRIRQLGQYDEVVRFLDSDNELLRLEDPNWIEFVGSQVAVWQAGQLNQKAIEQYGDQLSTWRSQANSPDEFDGAIQKLDFIVTLEPESQSQAWPASGSNALKERMNVFSRVVTGLAIIAANDTTEGDAEAFTAVSFGASLVVEGMSKLAPVT